MGNSAGKVKFDIVSRLSPELIFVIVGFLKPKHILQCLLVCQTWHQVITHLDPYWKERAVVKAGLTWEAARLSLHSFPSSRLFYVAARRYMTRLRKSRFQYARIGALEMEIENFQFVRIRCLQARAGILVHMVRTDREDRDGTELGVVVQRMSHDGPRVVVTDLYSVSLGQYSSLAWAYADSHSLLWVARAGMWGGYWVGEKGQDSVSFCTLHPLINDGQVVKLGCCTKCQLVVAAYWGQSLAAMETVCMLQAVKLSGGCCREVMKPKALKMSHSHGVFIHRDSRVWLREILVLSASEEKDDGVCRSHRLVLQCDCCTVLHALSLGGPGSSSGHCLHCSHGLQHGDTGRPTDFRNTSSEVCLSSDEQLLGLVFNNSLVVCQVDTGGERGTSLVSQAHLKHKPTHPCSDIHLAAVGHICSLVYFRSENYPMDYRLHVVSNQTGHMLTELCRAEKLYNWSPPHADDLLPQFHLTPHEEDWLSDVRRRVPLTPAVAVYSCHGKVHAESVLTTKSAFQSWREHWRCAVNFAFRH